MAEEDNVCDSTIADNLSLQLSEIEMLTSMFPDRSEFSLDEAVNTIEIQNFIDGKLHKDFLQTRVGFTLNIKVGEPPVWYKINNHKIIQFVCVIM